METILLIAAAILFVANALGIADGRAVSAGLACWVLSVLLPL